MTTIDSLKLLVGYLRLRWMAASAEDGVTTLEYIALGAVVLTMLGVIMVTVQASGPMIGARIGASFTQQINTWQ